MRGSAIRESWKSIAAKFHPQLPLSSKESNRLLNALTSSFRKHLDEVHPPPEGRQVEHQAKRAEKTSVAALHSSSAVFADKHLASVLTNPLLLRDGQPASHVASAKRDLEQGKDPLDLLEEYQAEDHASFEIATLCLNHVKKSLPKLSADERRQRIIDLKPGKRSLRWLWQSGLFERFAKDKLFNNLVVYFLVKEGDEDFLWKWLEQDHQISEKPEYRTDREKSWEETQYQTHRWKGYILRGIVAAKLCDEHEEAKCADAALQAICRAARIERAGKDEGNPPWISLGGAGAEVTTQLTFHPERWAKTNGHLFDEYLDLLRTLTKDGPPVDKLATQKLLLFHPDPAKIEWEPMYGILVEVMQGNAPAGHYNKTLLHPHNSAEAHRLSWFTCRVAHLVRQSGQHSRAAALLELLREARPNTTPYISTDMQRWKQRPALDHSRSEQKTRGSPSSTTTSFAV